MRELRLKNKILKAKLKKAVDLVRAFDEKSLRF